MNEKKNKRLVVAPQAGSTDTSAQIISVELAADENVRWQWAHYPDGTSAVTGYEIIRKDERSNK